MSRTKEHTTRQLQTFLHSRFHPMSDETYDKYCDIMRKLRRLDKLTKQSSDDLVSGVLVEKIITAVMRKDNYGFDWLRKEIRSLLKEPK